MYWKYILNCYDPYAPYSSGYFSHSVVIMLQVLAITEGLEDVYILGKEAATAHGALMADLSKVFLF